MVKIKAVKLSELVNKFIFYLIILFSIFIVIKLCYNFIESANKEIIEDTIKNSLPIYVSDSSFKKKFLTYTIKGQISYAEVVDTPVEEINVVEDNMAENLISESVSELYAEKLSETKVKVGTVKIENYTKRDLDLDELSKANSSIQFINEKPNVLIYHTHTSESYANVDTYTDYYRTEDAEYNVVSVGKTLTQKLREFGMTVTHSTAQHDYPSYNGAYKASLKTIENCMKTEKYDIVLDIHRDALAANSTFRPTAEIDGKSVAKLMFVVGTDTAGLEHDEWMKNLKFAIAFQEKANEMYPGLFRDIHLSTSRYNQHVCDKALIVEVGATGNTLEEANLAIELFAKVLNELT